MDILRYAAKLRPADVEAVPDATWKNILRKARELQRLCSLKFDTAAMGIGEITKCVLCLDLAAATMGVRLDRRLAIKAATVSEKAYANTMSSMQNALGVRPPMDLREIAIQFGCIRILETCKKNLNQFIQAFIGALPEGRKQSADFSHPMYPATAFFLTAKKQKLKVDKAKFLEVSKLSDEDLQRVSVLMQDTCPSVFGSRPLTGRKRVAPDGQQELESDSLEKEVAEESQGEMKQIDEGDKAPGDSFEAWKQKMREMEHFERETLEGNNKSQGSGRMKQAKLSFGKKQ